MAGAAAGAEPGSAATVWAVGVPAVSVAASAMLDGGEEKRVDGEKKSEGVQHGERRVSLPKSIENRSFRNGGNEGMTRDKRQTAVHSNPALRCEVLQNTTLGMYIPGFEVRISIAAQFSSIRDTGLRELPSSARAPRHCGCRAGKLHQRGAGALLCNIWQSNFFNMCRVNNSEV